MDEACSIVLQEQEATGAATFVWEVPDGWQQDRGAWGGLVVAALVRAASACDPGRPVRTVSAQIPSPVLVGPHVIRVRPLKRGSSLSAWSIAVSPEGDDATVAGATVLTGARRGTGLDCDDWGLSAVPSAPRWAAVPTVDVGPPIGPVFATNVEFRVIAGVPFSGADASALGYVALRDPVPWDAASLLGLVDAWWPASFARLDGPRPAATISFEAHLHCDPAEVPSEPLLFSSSVLAASDGYTTERRTLWHPDGRLVVENLQSIAIIR